MNEQSKSNNSIIIFLLLLIVVLLIALLFAVGYFIFRDKLSGVVDKEQTKTQVNHIAYVKQLGEQRFLSLEIARHKYFRRPMLPIKRLPMQMI